MLLRRLSGFAHFYSEILVDVYFYSGHVLPSNDCEGRGLRTVREWSDV